MKLGKKVSYCDIEAGEVFALKHDNGGIEICYKTLNNRGHGRGNNRPWHHSAIFLADDWDTHFDGSFERALPKLEDFIDPGDSISSPWSRSVWFDVYRLDIRCQRYWICE